MNVKFRVSYKIGKKGTLVSKKKISINNTQIGLVRTRIHSNTNSNLDIELLIYFHRPKFI